MKHINCAVIVAVSADPGDAEGLVPEGLEGSQKPSNVKLQERGLMIEEGETRRPEERMWIAVAAE